MAPVNNGAAGAQCRIPASSWPPYAESSIIYPKRAISEQLAGHSATGSSVSRARTAAHWQRQILQRFSRGRAMRSRRMRTGVSWAATVHLHPRGRKLEQIRNSHHVGLCSIGSKACPGCAESRESHQQSVLVRNILLSFVLSQGASHSEGNWRQVGCKRLDIQEIGCGRPFVLSQVKQKQSSGPGLRLFNLRSKGSFAGPRQSQSYLWAMRPSDHQRGSTEPLGRP